MRDLSSQSISQIQEKRFPKLLRSKAWVPPGLCFPQDTGEDMMMQQLHSKPVVFKPLQKRHQRNADCWRPFHNFLPWRKGGGRRGEEKEERQRGGIIRERGREKRGWRREGEQRKEYFWKRSTLLPNVFWNPEASTLGFLFILFFRGLGFEK